MTRPPFALKADVNCRLRVCDVIKSRMMGPHRLQLGDAGGGRKTGNLFGVALAVDLSTCTVETSMMTFLAVVSNFNKSYASQAWKERLKY